MSDNSEDALPIGLAVKCYVYTCTMYTLVIMSLQLYMYIRYVRRYFTYNIGIMNVVTH